MYKLIDQTKYFFKFFDDLHKTKIYFNQVHEKYIFLKHVNQAIVNHILRKRREFHLLRKSNIICLT